MRTSRRLVIALLVLLLLPVGVVSAVEIMQETTCTIAQGETMRGNLYVACRDLTIDGTVDGHVFGAVVSARINGTVTRNLYLLAGEVVIAGEVAGDVHVAGGVLSYPAPDEPGQIVNSDIVALTLSTEIAPGAQVAGEIVSLGYQLVMGGDTAGSIDFWGSTLSIGGQVGGDVTATVGSSETVGTATQIETLLIFLPIQTTLYDPGLTLTPEAFIAGDLTYRAYTAQDFAQQVGGAITFTALQTAPTFEDLAIEENRGTALGLYFQQVAREFTTLGLLGFALLALTPGFIRMAIFHIRHSAWSSLGLGALCFTISFPVLLVVVVISLLILFLLSFLNLDGLLFAGGVLVGLVNIGGTSLFYFAAIYASRAIVCIALGRLIVYRFDPSSTFRAWFISLLIGTGILALTASLPLIGFIVNAGALFVGLGAIIHVIQTQLRRLREPSESAVRAASHPVTAVPVIIPAPPPRPIPPPILEERAPRPLGMDNLPEGFTWWDDDAD